MQYNQSRDIARPQFLCSVLHHIHAVQRLIWPFIALIIDSLFLIAYGYRITDLTRTVYIVLLFTQIRATHMSRCSLIIALLSCLIVALIEQSSAWTELYIIACSQVVLTHIAPYIVTTQFAQRTVITLAIWGMILSSCVLHPCAPAYGWIMLRAGIALTILLTSLT